MSQLFATDEIERDASFSNDGRYRWSLSRCWDFAGGRNWVGWIMLNPSIANDERDDPTITRCIGFARAWGYCGITVRNLFGFITSKPKVLKKAAHPICPPGQETYYDQLITRLPEVCPVIVAAWGAHSQARQRGQQVAELCRRHGIRLKCLGLTKDGFPLHPLFVPASAKLVDYQEAA